MLLARLSDLISNITGLYFPEERFSDLERGIISASKDFGFSNSKDFIHWLLSTNLDEEQVKKLALHLTVGETYFFRDMRSLEILRDNILPEYIQKLKLGIKPLKIWCAGCSTGEEPYSLAIWLDTILPELNYMDIKIFATDINTNSLAKANTGIYSQWSFRNTPNWVKTNYFITDEKNFILSERIKNMVKFFYLNLVEDSYPSILNSIHEIDIILCRNVLMYFNKETYKSVVDKFYRTLNNDGYLLVSAVETSQELYKNFRSINFTGLSVYKKDVNKTDSDNNFYIDLEFQEINKIYQQDLSNNIKEKEKNEKEKNKIHDKYKEAEESYKDGNYETAEKIILEIFAKHKKKYLEVINIKELIIMMINIYASKRKFEESEYWCKKGIQFDKLEIKFHYLLSNIFQEQNKYDEAIEALKKILFLDHDFLLAHFLLGNIYQQQEKYDDSKKHFEIALSLLNKYDDKQTIEGSEDITSDQMKKIIRINLKNIR